MADESGGGAPDAESASYLERHVLRILSVASLLLIATATVVYHLLEDWSLVDSFYFSTVAISTVGFGDLAPSTDASKLFTVLYLALGISVVTTFFNARLKYSVSRRKR